MTRDAYLTVKEAASELRITDDGVRKLIRRGSIRAVKQSERKTLIPRPAFDAYLRKIHGKTTPPLGRAKPYGSLIDRVDAFTRDTGLTPEEYLAGWLSADPQSETANAMAVAVGAFGLVAEQRAAKVPDFTPPADVTAEDYRILAGVASTRPHNTPAPSGKLTRR